MRRMKTLESFQPAQHSMSWPKRLGVLLVAEAGWFLFLHPLVPSTLAGLVAEFAAELVVLGLVYVGVRAIVWLQGRPINRSLSAVLCLAIAIGVGAAIFGAAYWCRAFLTGNFVYLH